MMADPEISGTRNSVPPESDSSLGAAQAWASVALKFGENGPTLTIGKAGTNAGTFLLVRKGDHWKLHSLAGGNPAGAQTSSDAATIITIPRKPAPPSGARAPHHPSLQAELYVVEQHGRDEVIAPFNWDRPPTGPAESEGLFQRKNKRSGVYAGQVGTGWIRVGGARLAISIMPRHFLELGLGGAVTNNSVATLVERAMLRLQAMVQDLWDDAIDHRADKTPGAIPISDGGARSTEWFQRLARVENLVVHKGVREAWQALMAEPVVTLISEYPIAPIIMAKRPVWSGPRGPWTLPGGWSPDRPDGNVRDRVVRRTTDTPPNRLAVGLAQLVIRELSDIQRKMGRDSTLVLVENFRGSGLGRLAATLRQEAEMVVQCPGFAEVSRTQSVALDSPSLQNNSRCRPLLEAWARIHRGLGNDADIPLDDAMMEPIASVELLYERWCFRALCKAAASAMSVAPDRLDTRDFPGDILLHRRYSKNGTTVEILHQMNKVVMTESGEGREKRRGTWHGRVRSWSPVFRPDGFIIVDGRAVHAWDAKYRKLKGAPSDDGISGAFESGYLYQAHAFRDALRYQIIPRGAFEPLSWSFAIHPGVLPDRDTEPPKATGGGARPENRIQIHLYPIGDDGASAGEWTNEPPKPKTQFADELGPAGVGIVAADPGVDLGIVAHLRQLIEWLPKITGDVPANRGAA